MIIDQNNSSEVCNVNNGKNYKGIHGVPLQIINYDDYSAERGREHHFEGPTPKEESILLPYNGGIYSYVANACKNLKT